MRIALISTQRTAVPPPKTGSVELIVALMAAELTRRGHDVTVFATADSRPAARLCSTLPTGYHHDASIWDWELAEFMQLGRAYERAHEFDVIHSHVYCWALPFSRLVRTPTVHTFHICPTPDHLRFCSMYPEGRYIALSGFQAGLFREVPVAAVVPNGIDTAAFEFSPKPGGYLAYLGDIREDKGPMDSIRVAQAAGVPLRIAGPRTRYYLEVVQPHVDGRSIQYVGEVDHAAKVDLLKGAVALLFPVTALEACPLVIMESMACGTPVLAVGRGPVPELVDQGVNGIWVDDVRSMVEQVATVARLDRQAIRDTAVRRFDVARVVDDYVRVYQDAVDGSGSESESACAPVSPTNERRNG